MQKFPQVGPSDDADDFRDSSLINLQLSPDLCVITAILSTPDEHGFQRLWQLTFSGVLRFEFEQSGDGSPSARGEPVPIDNVYDARDNPERGRWVEHLRVRGVGVREAEDIKYVVLANSFLRGFGGRENLHGITIVCRHVEVGYAPSRYHRQEFGGRIQGAPDDDGSIH